MFKNPYFHVKPIQDQRYFYGRQIETNELVHAVNYNQCVSVVGSRKIGKTSLLFHLQSAGPAQLPDQENRHIYVYVDGQAYQAAHPSEFYAAVVEDIGMALGEIGEQVLAVERPHEGMAFTHVRRAIRSLIQRHIRPVFLLDEFESLCENRRFDLPFFNGLRSLATLGAAYVTASVQPLFQLDREKELLGSPFFNYFTSLHLGLLDAPSASRLVCDPAAERGVYFDEAVVQEILELGGGHPFFLQRVCFVAFDLACRQGREFDAQSLKQLRDKSMSMLDAHMSSYWRRLKSEARQVVSGVVKGETMQSVSAVVTDELSRMGLLIQRADGYRIFSPLFRDYVKTQSHPRDVRPQRWLDRFDFKEVLGHGSMSVVHRAFQPALARDVAIKELRPHGDTLDEGMDRFLQEARAIALLDHPNILPVYDFYQEGDRAYLVMKLASAGSLADRLEEMDGPFDPTQAIQIGIHIGRALAYAHRQHVIHRDVKPANIFMGEDGWPLLGDFGLAMSRGESPARESGMTGSSDYVSPEQAMDSRDADPRSDIYSLGIVLYRLLVGAVPHAEDPCDASRLMRRITHGIPAPSSLNPDISLEVERIILKATASTVEDRYQSARRMVEDLEAANDMWGMDFEEDEFSYDVFVSYSRPDRDWVKQVLLPKLEGVGLRVCIDYRDFQVGKSELVNIEEAVMQSRKTVIVLTPSYVLNEWTTFQGLLVQSNDPAGRDARMLPVLLRECEIPWRIDMLTRVDLSGQERDEGWQQLLSSLETHPRGLWPEPIENDLLSGIDDVADDALSLMEQQVPATKSELNVLYLLLGTLVVLVIFVATVYVLVWAGQRVPFSVLLLVLVVTMVIDLASIVSVLVISGAIDAHAAAPLLDALVSKIPLLRFGPFSRASQSKTRASQGHLSGEDRDS